MKKSILFIVIGLIIFTFIVVISAQSKKEDIKIGRNYRNISQFGLREFINMDLALIGYFPRENDWKQIAKKIKLVPVDSLRYIDSLDVRKIADTLYVRVYAQNYAYQSSNTYKLAKSNHKSTDTLMIFNSVIDLKMKDSIADAPTFRIKNYTVNYITKQNAADIDQMIVINKIFQR